ncbi:MAG TPA: STAS domain-containing protein [Candidatus Aquilonibacter sp.]|nr:STAS domain-containing protein [Candidatus Aquilonibacter sp.]
MPETAVAPVLWTEVEHPEAGVVVVRCFGRLVSGGADELLYRTVRELIPGSSRVVLDLKELKHTDSMGLGTLVRLYVHAKGAGCRLELMHLNKQIRNLLGLTGLWEVFAIAGENNVKWM